MESRLTARHGTSHVLPHIPALDGLRGVALLGVLFFHANGALPGGYLGVDLFFVLSGYLITSLLLAEHDRTGRVDLSAFWLRRARRLFPALLSLMPAIAVYAVCFAKPDELTGLRADALATLGYVANWRAILSHESYWQLFAAPSPLEHTWSLSIEEQFYVVWPLVVILLLRRHTKRAVLGLAVVLALLSMAATIVLFHPGDTSRVYLGTDTRAVGILAGAMLAVVVSPNDPRLTRWGRELDVSGVVAAVLLGIAWWALPGDSWFLFHGGLWLTEIAALVLVVCSVARPASLVARALAVRPLTLLGTVSYGVYLWHWPVHVVLTPARVHVGPLALGALQFAVTFAIAGVSYRFLESPILKRGVPFGRPLYVAPAVVLISILLVVRATHAEKPPSEVLAVASPAAAAPSVPAFRIMLVGDSTANSLGWALRGVQRPGVEVESRGVDGCTMLADLCGGADWAKETDELRPDATLLVLGGAFMHGITVDGEWSKSCHQEWDRRFERTVETRLADLASPGGQVWVVMTPYPLGVWDNPTIRIEVDCINASIRKVAALVPGVEILELAGYLCPHGACEVVTVDGVVIRPDGVHYAIDGALGMSRWVLDQVQREQVQRERVAPKLAAVR